MRRAAALTALWLGTACVSSAEPTGFVFQYQIRALDCGVTCADPGITDRTSAARGDTVWLQHNIQVLQLVGDSVRATLRPPCAENVAIELGPSVVRTAPDPMTCADSTEARYFKLGEPVIRYTRWVADLQLTATIYAVVGRVLVQPVIEPSLAFTLQ